MSPFTAISAFRCVVVRPGSLNDPPPVTRTAVVAERSRAVAELSVGVPAPPPRKFAAITLPEVEIIPLARILPPATLLVLLGKAGLVSSRGLAAMRKYAVVAILALAAIATPPDVMSQIILFVAIYPLYEVSIFLIRRIEKKREAQARADGTWVDEDEDDAA